jgi:hypothetical protein
LYGIETAGDVTTGHYAGTQQQESENVLRVHCQDSSAAVDAAIGKNVAGPGFVLG